MHTIHAKNITYSNRPQITCKNCPHECGYDWRKLHNTAQHSSDNLPSDPPDNQHNSDVIYCRQLHRERQEHCGNSVVMVTKSAVLPREWRWQIRCYHGGRVGMGTVLFGNIGGTSPTNHLRINFLLFGRTYSRRRTNKAARRLCW